MRTPDEERLAEIGRFFGVTVEYLRQDTAAAPPPPESGRSGEQPDGGVTTGSVFVPVLVVLPLQALPSDLKTLYTRISAALNPTMPAPVQPDS